MDYEIFTWGERWDLPYLDRVRRLIEVLGSLGLDARLNHPWELSTNERGSVKLRGKGGSHFPLGFFRRYRNIMVVYGFLSGVIYVHRYWGEEYPPIPTGWDWGLPDWVSVDQMVEYINRNSPPKGPWFVLEGGTGMLSLRGGEPAKYHWVVNDYGNYFYSRREIHWFLVGVCYALAHR